ncbi:putative translation initiation factor [Choiromyces venosus 120613-1]|uniref:Methylthioribose-1-phosphate isomerase n=1 Tax=Choiromyces venosus 120613-1 TaxID=1336337 RepID=A0A3N4J4L2_9PEZI|nr:putative translation initiation factor [Choiromyces venosus 120613-1]
MSLQAILYTPSTTRPTLQILDQLKLPHESVYVPIHTCEDAYDAIKRMVVRGAPAIAIVAALALAVELSSASSYGETAEAARKYVHERLDYLMQSRPTAVNLADAAGKLKVVVDAEAEDESAEMVVGRYVRAAEKMLGDDVKDNENIGRFGAEWILGNAKVGEEGRVAVLTHCNTGSLATAGYGTALGIIRSLHSGSNLTHAYCTETRPYNQGSRLTAYELVHDKIPATLITDSMASSLMNLKSVAAVIVGADRVAANGDTANKIGTYQLAIVAKYHGVKFVVAAPTASIDMKTASGKDIVIEHRSGKEVTHVETVVTAARGINVYNPSFDVTPKDLIDAIVTEKGVVVKNAGGDFDLSRLFWGVQR